MRRLGDIPLREAIVPLLFIGGVTADFSPLSVHLSLLVSDVCLIAAGVISLPYALAQAPQAFLRFLESHRSFLVAAVLGVLFLVGTGLSTLLAGAPRAGVETWLLFALLVGLVVPLTALATAHSDIARRWLGRGLLLGATIGSLGFVGKAVTGSAPSYGFRSSGLFGSDPLLLIIVGLTIVLTRIGSRLRAPERRLQPILLLELVLVGLFVAALAVSRYRAGWVAAIAAVLWVTALYARSLKVFAAVAFALVAVGVTSYKLSILPDTVQTRIEQSFDSSQPDFFARREVAKRLLWVWTQEPWGIGLNESVRYVPPVFASGRVDSIHNFVANGLVEGGPLAALPLAVFPFLLTAMWLRRHPQHHRPWERTWGIAALWPAFIAAQFATSLYQHAAWIAVGAALGASVRHVGEARVDTP